MQNRIIKMKIILVILLLQVFTVTAHTQKGRAVENFDFNWKFRLGDIPEAKDASFDDADWRDIQLPHDFSIEQEVENDSRLGANGFFPGGVGWYRKTFTAPKSYAGKRIFICFDGVYHRSDVWINGQHLGFRPYGYVSFEYELTPHLIAGGDNVIVVRADHSNASSSRWYSGSGIYRHVRLKIVDPVHVDLWGIYITTPKITPSEAVVEIETTVKNDDKTAKQVKLSTEIFSDNGMKAGAATLTLNIEAERTATFKQNITVKQPVLWDIDSPTLYTAVTKIKSGAYTDEVSTDFGFRTLEWDTQKGFFLNGKNMKLKGVNLHHDGGLVVGAAVPERIWEMRLAGLKDIGCNFIRTSHNPPAPEFLDICDRMGFLVQDEAFDKWKSGYYSEYYDEWWKTDLQSMLQRDRNHPSIILWSVGNEVAEQGKPEGAERFEKMVAFVHEYEGSRKVTAGLFPSESNHNTYGFADKPDIVGHNYNELFYEADKAKYPNRIILGTENYLYYRGLPGSGMNFESKKHSWADVTEHDWVVGWTLWPGIDYIGETRRFNMKGWPTGIMDASGREKTIAGLYRSFWKDAPQLHIAVLNDALDIDPGSLNWSSPKMIAHWNFPEHENQIVRVHTFSNCDSVALWVNNRSIGKRAVADYNNNTIEWNVPYIKGTLKTAGYRDGKEVVKTELRSAGDSVNISLQNLVSNIKADGQDVAIVEVLLKDENGQTVQHDDRKITFALEGDATLLGIDNGDLRMKEPMRANSLSTYFGRCIVIIRAGKKPENIILSATGEGLNKSSVSIPVK
jgi:beta-galactosidase